MNNDVLLKVDKLSIAYGVITAVNNMSFHVKKGEIVTLLGSNGAGKSSTLRGISRLEKLKGGKIIFDGVDTSKMSPHEIVARGLVHVPEGRRIFVDMTVEENLIIGARLVKDHSVLKERKEQAFSLFPRLEERRQQRGGTLSGGEQQMLAVARALMADSQMILMDEPSMGLAPMLVQQIFDTIKQINKLGKTILLVEQNAHQSLKISDRAYVISHGEIILEGTGEELLNSARIQEAYLGI